MKHVKTLILFALLLCLVLMLAACNGDGTGTGTGTETETGTGGAPFNPCVNGHDLVSNADFYTCKKCDFKHATSKGLEYKVLDEGEKTCEITGSGTCTDTEIYIPSVIDGYTVTSIGGGAFMFCENLTDVVIPNTVKSLGDGVFYECNRLVSITIPASVTEIGEAVIMSCNRLASIKVQDGNGTYHAAGNCLIQTRKKTLIAGCKNSVIPNDGSVTTIAKRAFEGCGTLLTITIPSSVTRIHDYAFKDCYRLTEVYNLSSAIKVNKGSRNDTGCIGYYALAVHTSADTPSKFWTDANGYRFYEDGDECYLTGYTGTERALSLPESCNGKNYKIYQYAFYNCDDLESVIIPRNVTYIGHSSFADCRNLKSVIVEENSRLTTIFHYAFYRCYGLESITIPLEVILIGENAFNNCTGLTTLYYGGTEQNWQRLISGNPYAFLGHILSSNIYYYSPTEPTTARKFWRYVDGVPTPWN